MKFLLPPVGQKYSGQAHKDQRLSILPLLQASEEAKASSLACIRIDGKRFGCNQNESLPVGQTAKAVFGHNGRHGKQTTLPLSEPPYSCEANLLPSLGIPYLLLCFVHKNPFRYE